MLRMGIEWKYTSPVETKDIIKEVRRKAVYPQSLTDAIKHLSVPPSQTTLVFRHETRTGLQNFTKLAWHPIKKEFELKVFSEDKDKTEKELLDKNRALQFNINERVGKKGEGFNMFIEHKLSTLLQEGYSLDYAKIIFKRSMLFSKKNEALTMRFDPDAIMRSPDDKIRTHTATLEVGKNANHKTQLKSWFDKIPGPTFDRYYI